MSHRRLIERLLALAPTEAIDLNDLDLSATVTPLVVRRGPVAAQGEMGLRGEPLSAIDGAERAAIRTALEQAKWNRREAALGLGIHRNTLRAKIEKYGL